jgi:hypothetical protein
MILMIVSLISILGLRLVYNNKVHRALKIDKSDLYKVKINYTGNMEEIITEINIYSMKNKDIINEIKESGVRKIILDNAVSLQYVKAMGIFKVIYNKGIRYNFDLRYKVVEDNVYFLPKEKYMVLEGSG